MTDHVPNGRTPTDANAADRAAAKQLPNWREIYQQIPTTQMPWYYPDLDPDLSRALETYGLHGGSALDLGTGPGTQAFKLAEHGFAVTGSDISPGAVMLASEEAQRRGLDVQFVQDDVLATRLSGAFDIVFDRGCFHVIAPSDRAQYVEAVAKLVKPNGYFFLKCFSDEQPGDVGPYRLPPAEVEAVFRSKLQLLSIERTIYQGTLADQPRALFCSFQRR